MGHLYRVYGQKSAKFLENLTHREDPWINARGSRAIEERCNEIISKEAMAEYYTKLLKAHGQEE